MEKPAAACYHLPGLFEFYELYRCFLPLYREHREYFYDWCTIGSIYGAPAGCIWGGGRISCGGATAREVLALLREYGISGRLTFSNSLLRAEHLADPQCNALCEQFAKSGSVPNGVIVHSDLLADYLQQRWPELYLVSSTTKVLTEFAELRQELEKPQFRYVVPDFRLNPALEQLRTLPPEQKAKVEFLCNECCWFGCTERKRCYETVSRQNLGEDCPDAPLRRPGCRRGLPLFQGDAQPRIYWGGGHPAAVPARRLFSVQDRGQRAWQRTGTGISALLHDKAGIPAASAGGNLSGQYAGSFLRKLHRADHFLSGAALCLRDLYRKTFFSLQSVLQ